MEVSSLSTSPRAYTSTDSLLLKRVKLPSWHHRFVSISWSRRNRQPLLGIMQSTERNSCCRGRLWCMDETYDTLAERFLSTSAVPSNDNAKYIVGLAGPLGAGKSTLASEIVQCINKMWPQKASSFNSQVKLPDVAIFLPMYRFHLYRSRPDAMEESHARRGAPWTFDPLLLLNCMKNLRNQGSDYAPSFDHGAGDPVEDDIFVGLQILVKTFNLNNAVFGETKTGLFA